MFCKIYITIIIDCHNINRTSSRAQVNFKKKKKKGYEFQDKFKRSIGGGEEEHVGTKLQRSLKEEEEERGIRTEFLDKIQ